MATVELGVVVEGSANADEDGVVEGTDEVSHEDGLWATEEELVAVLSCDLGIEGLGKGEGDVGSGGGRRKREVGEG